MDTRSALGRAGEGLAAKHLESLGYVVVDRNFRCRAGEVDVIARGRGLVVFCEVKTRHSAQWGRPAEAVGHLKQMRIRRVAAQWLREHSPGAVDIRFDVVSVIVSRGQAELDHLPDAF